MGFMHWSRQGRHALVIFEHEFGHVCPRVCPRVWGGGGGGSPCDTQQPQQHLCFIYFFLFIRNIPKRINYILILTFIDYVDGQSNLIM